MTERLGCEQLLTELHAARIAGSVQRLCDVFAQDVVFRIAGASEGRPICIQAAGLIEVRPWLAMLAKTFRLSDYELLARIIDGNRAAVHWRARIHSRVTGTVVLTELVDVIEIRNLQIVSYAEFFVPR